MATTSKWRVLRPAVSVPTAVMFLGSRVLSWLQTSDTILNAWPRLISMLRPLAEFVLSGAGQVTLLIALAVFLIAAWIQDRHEAALAAMTRQQRKRLGKLSKWRRIANEYAPIGLAVAVLAIGVVLWLPTRPDWSIVVVARVPTDKNVFPITFEIVSGEKDLRAVDFRCVEHGSITKHGSRSYDNVMTSASYLEVVSRGNPVLINCNTFIGVSPNDMWVKSEVSFDLTYSLVNTQGRKRARRTFTLIAEDPSKLRWDLKNTNWDDPSTGAQKSYMARPSKEYQAFRNLTDRLLTVSKETVDKRVAAYKAEREQTPRELRPGRNPKGYRRKSEDRDE